MDDKRIKALACNILGPLDDRVGEPGFDANLAADLGRALATERERQIMVGSNASGRTLGLLNVTSALSSTADDASPTAQEIITKLGSAYASIAGSSGQGVSDLDRFLLILHSRRLAYLYGNAQASESIAPVLPGRVVASSAPCARTSAQAPTRTTAFFWSETCFPTFSGPVHFMASEALSGTLQVRAGPHNGVRDRVR